MTEFFKINGKTIKPPTEISFSFENLDKEERTLDGTMVVDLIAQKRKVDVSWEYLSKEDMAILSAETRNGVFVAVSYNDNSTGALTTMTARPQSLTYQPHFEWAKNRLIWKSVSISFVER